MDLLNLYFLCAEEEQVPGFKRVEGEEGEREEVEERKGLSSSVPRVGGAHFREPSPRERGGFAPFPIPVLLSLILRLGVTIGVRGDDSSSKVVGTDNGVWISGGEARRVLSISISTSANAAVVPAPTSKNGLSSCISLIGAAPIKADALRDDDGASSALELELELVVDVVIVHPLLALSRIPPIPTPRP